MIRKLIALCVCAGLAGCGDGNPFDVTETGPDPEVTPDPTSPIPENVAGSVDSFTFDPAAGTLTLTGTLRDGDTLTTTFNRKPALDQGAYQAFTVQDDPLDEHTTVYVRAIGDVFAATAATGGQFTFYSGGSSYGRRGLYTPVTPSEATDTGLVTYAGEYVGLTNVNGANTDLLPVPGGVTPSVRPAQAGVVNGKIFVNVSFGDNNVSGIVTERVVQTGIVGPVAVGDLAFVPTTLNSDGTFSGEVQLERTNVGNYAGTLGGVQATAMAGALYADEHFGDDLTDAGGNPITIEDEEEYGIFVLGRCGGPLEDPSPECDAVE